MAIIFENQTICPLCNDVLNKSREYILIPPLISNELDDLFIFSDAGVHLNCLDRSSLKENLFKHIDLYGQYLNRIRSMATHHNNYDIIGFNLLTSNNDEPLSKYNYYILSKQELLDWKELDIFKNIAETFLKEKKWKGFNDFNYLDYLLKIVTEIS
ncbi:hypothetical protein [uncultured Chryseobacterium sp.]|uniref:hypothetical protein n=1 Tax=uncultured Chryseobacterium sp. TaxID=259322 RepID=UPI0025CBFB75|nr:hypothetical protein [uncultured Chryseobacterium sp.]